LIGVNFHGGGLIDKIQAQQNGRHAVTFLNPSFQPLQRTGLDADAHALTDRRGETNFQIHFQREKNVVQLLAKRFLIEDVEKIRHVIVLAHGILLMVFELEKHVAREQRFLENHRLAAILVRGLAAGKRGREMLPATILDQLFLPSRFRMRDEPKQLGHAAENFRPARRRQSENRRPRNERYCLFPPDGENFGRRSWDPLEWCQTKNAAMRSETDKAKLAVFMAALGNRVRGAGRIYLTGGATAVLHGWRPMTIDIDLKGDPEPAGLFEALAALKNGLDINVELASPDQFIPPIPGWRERSLHIARHGQLDFYHYDPYSQALSKLQRGHTRDLLDVRSMLRDGLIRCRQLQEMFDSIESELIRYPAIDPASFRTAVEEFCRSAADPHDTR